MGHRANDLSPLAQKFPFIQNSILLSSCFSVGFEIYSEFYTTIIRLWCEASSYFLKTN